MNSPIAMSILDYLDEEGGHDAQEIFMFMAGIYFPWEYGAFWVLNKPYIEGWQMLPSMDRMVMRLKINVHTAELTTTNPLTDT